MYGQMFVSHLYFFVCDLFVILKSSYRILRVTYVHANNYKYEYLRIRRNAIRKNVYTKKYDTKKCVCEEMRYGRKNTNKCVYENLLIRINAYRYEEMWIRKHTHTYHTTICVRKNAIRKCVRTRAGRLWFSMALIPNLVSPNKHTEASKCPVCSKLDRDSQSPHSPDLHIFSRNGCAFPLPERRNVDLFSYFRQCA